MARTTSAANTTTLETVVDPIAAIRIAREGEFSFPKAEQAALVPVVKRSASRERFSEDDALISFIQDSGWNDVKTQKNPRQPPRPRPRVRYGPLEQVAGPGQQGSTAARQSRMTAIDCTCAGHLGVPFSFAAASLSACASTTPAPLVHAQNHPAMCGNRHSTGAFKLHYYE
ncbi:hypothetical protein PQR34_25885 [Paraburkholderia sediminicola]|uniref:hypothetical protein n=1 Tax=Paraburkholderia sediminicola TaxID=458836 RepID=UPI0038B957FE